ncbi:MAG TPA: hypothetical protein VL096_18770 [Pirellulaceae bacterium]|nr:hypothetical protein [Pirellulaceae bacterium]
MVHGRDQHAAGASRFALLRTLAAALLAGLVVFFAGEAFWHPAVTEFVARAVVQCPNAANSGQSVVDLEAARAAITSDSAWQEAVRGTVSSDDSPDLLRSRLLIYRQFEANSSEPRLAIELGCANEDLATTIVDRLSRRLTATTTGAQAAIFLDPSELTTARQRRAAAQTKEDAARRVLDGLTRRSFDTSRSLESSLTELQPEAIAATVPAAKLDNSAWVKLGDEVKALEAKRDSLLARLTNEHPLVLDVEAELADVESRFKNTPRHLAGDAAPAVPAREAFPQQEYAEVLDKMRVMADERTKYRLAYDHYEQARNERIAAEAAIDVLSQPGAVVPGTASAFTLVQPARIVDRIPAIAPLTRTAILALAGLLVTLLAAVLLRPRSSNNILETADDVERLLGLPVVARLGASGRLG